MNTASNLKDGDVEKDSSHYHKSLFDLFCVLCTELGMENVATSAGFFRTVSKMPGLGIRKHNKTHFYWRHPQHPVVTVGAIITYMLPRDWGRRPLLRRARGGNGSGGGFAPVALAALVLGGAAPVLGATVPAWVLLGGGGGGAFALRGRAAWLGLRYCTGYYVLVNWADAFMVAHAALPPSTVALGLTLEPPFTALFEWLAVGDAPSLGQVAGPRWRAWGSRSSWAA
jgi:hypothetical protein